MDEIQEIVNTSVELYKQGELLYSGDAARSMNKLSHLRHDLLNVMFCSFMNVYAHDDITFWSYVNFLKSHKNLTKNLTKSQKNWRLY